uniref:Uncharacterized protein n=1 Tax=Panagrolaimus sp. ES5 TaxID=591445 RepID=A0AC34FI67_9BILA
MFFKLYVFAVLIFVAVSDEIDEMDDANLYNHAIEMKHVIASVDYKGQQINVWKDKSHDRFYAFPICVVEMNTMRCEENKLLNPSKHALIFTVRLWDDEIRETVHSTILNYENNTVKKESVKILPMQKVRLQAREGNIKVDSEWRSFQNQPSDMEFEVFVKDANFCKVVLNQSIDAPQQFFTQSQLEFEFTMVAQQQSTRAMNITSEMLQKSELYTRLTNFYDKISNVVLNQSIDAPQQFFTQSQLEFEFTMVAQQQSTRAINITSEMLQKSELYTRLTNFYDKIGNDSSEAGSIFLDSDDIKKLARELYNVASASEEVSSDYVASKEEDKLINTMIEKLYEEKVDAKEIFEKDSDSVFWDKKFATPDKVTRYLNNILTYNKSDNLYHYDEQKDKQFRGDLYNQETSSSDGSGSIGGGGSFLDIISVDSKWDADFKKNDTNTNQNKTETIDKKAFSSDEISKALEKNGISVEVEGEIFIPKSRDLYRVNLNKLNNKNEVFFDKMIVTPVESTLKALLKPDMESLTLFPGTVFFY